MDEIRIEELEVYAYHGVYPEENKLGQPFYVNAVLYLDTRKAGKTDELEASVHYGEVCHFITKWMKEHTCKLIEAVAENTAQEVLFAFPLIREIELEIRKPQAPIGLPFHSVSVKIKRGWHEAYIAFGSNLGDSTAIIAKALQTMKENRFVRVKKVSDSIVTKPYGVVEQEDFLNGALSIETVWYPEELLAFLHELESEAQREKAVRWGPRTLDLDILLYDRLVYEDDELIIPHVDMQNRDFVLKPMVQIAPNVRHPVLFKTMQELLEELPER